MKPNCLICGHKIPLSNIKYCSRTCSTKGRIGHKPTHWKGGKLVHKGYIYILQKGHPRADRDGYILEHRIIMEKHIGRYLLSEENIHHINHIKNDNRIENLFLTSRKNHGKIHYPKGKHFYKEIHPWLGRKHTEITKEKFRLRKRKSSGQFV